MNQIERIRAMEARLNRASQAVLRLSEALHQYEDVQQDYKKLCDYYGSHRWMKDFEDDEAGKLPPDLKRGVLSEDAVYDLITENHGLQIRLMKLLTRQMENHL